MLRSTPVSEPTAARTPARGQRIGDVRIHRPRRDRGTILTRLAARLRRALTR